MTKPRNPCTRFGWNPHRLRVCKICGGQCGQCGGIAEPSYVWDPALGDWKRNEDFMRPEAKRWDRIGYGIGFFSFLVIIGCIFYFTLTG